MKHIIVIDTDVDHLTLVQLILSANGYEVHSHSKWNEGYHRIEIINPCAIIIEVFLDTADGRNLAKQIKQKKSTQHIPIILLSKDPRVKETLNECKADEFILKPLHIDHFIYTVKKLIAA